MTETLAAPVQPAAAPSATAPGTATAAASPTTAADAFLAALLAMTAAPPGTPAPSARTAPAEGAKTGGDSSDKKTGTETDGNDPAQASTQGLMALLALGTLPVQVTGKALAVPAQAGSTAQAPTKRSVDAVTALGGAAPPAAEVAAATGPIVNAMGPDSGPADKGGAVRLDRGHQPGGPVPAPPIDRQREPLTAPSVQQGGSTPQDGQAQQGSTTGRDGSRHPKPDTAPVAQVQGTSTTPATQTATPVQQQRTPSVDAPADKPVTLRELPEAVQTAVRVAVRDGRTTASVELHPAELGRVEIRLRYDAGGGVTATVTAESHVAASALSAQAPDLRRALEAQGFTVLGLDIGQAGVGSEASPDRDRLGSFERQPDGGPSSTEDEPADITTIDVARLPLASGQLDVLA